MLEEKSLFSDWLNRAHATEGFHAMAPQILCWVRQLGEHCCLWDCLFSAPLNPTDPGSKVRGTFASTHPVHPASASTSLVFMAK